MTEHRSAPSLQASTPIFQHVAEQTAIHLMKYSASELAQMLNINPQLAALNKLRYTHFLDPSPTLPAIFSYTGIAYKKLNATNLQIEQLRYADQHLWITSFLYGLLRPLNGIKNYRLEGGIQLLAYENKTLFEFWKPKLTQVLIDATLADDGVLLNIASAEMKNLFDWKRIKKTIRIIEPSFKVYKNGKLKTIVVYTKMCRGAMARHAIIHQVNTIEQLKTFTYEGFTYNDKESKGDNLVFTL